jgi:integrase
MARTVEKLSALRVARNLAAGMYPDGAGLYLKVTDAGAKSWVYRFALRKKKRYMGLGSFPAISLADARAKVGAYRKLVQDGIDPIEHRRIRRSQVELEQAKETMFKQAADRYIKLHRAGWKNAKHASQWENTLASYAYPFIGDLSVQQIDTVLVCKVLEPIWTIKPETANRIRSRIETVLDWAKARGLREGENPARWRGHLQYQLPKRSKVRRVRHHPALPFADLPDFISELREQRGVAATALEFTILTAARTNETIGAVRREVDIENEIWAVSADRMKADQEHRKPLSARALSILRGSTGQEFIFPSDESGKPLSNMAMLEVIRRINEKRTAKGEPRFVDPKQSDADITVHGFRSTFRDWASETTSFPSEVVEMALAHAIGDKTEAAYRRGDLFEKRRGLMAEWASYCNPTKS